MEYLVVEAARAHTNLCIFGALKSILEGGNISQLGKAHRTSEKILALCDLEIQRQLEIYDAAIAKAEIKP